MKLSEQNLVDCVYSYDGCNSGWMHEAWDYIYKNKGVNLRMVYQYTRKYSGSCLFNSAYVGAKDNGTMLVNRGIPNDLLVYSVATVGLENFQINIFYQKQIITE